MSQVGASFCNHHWKRSYSSHWNDDSLFQPLNTSTLVQCVVIDHFIALGRRTHFDTYQWIVKSLNSFATRKALSIWRTFFKPKLMHVATTFTKTLPRKKLKLEIKFWLSWKLMKNHKRLTHIAVQSRPWLVYQNN